MVRGANKRERERSIVFPFHPGRENIPEELLPALAAIWSWFVSDACCAAGRPARFLSLSVDKGIKHPSCDGVINLRTSGKGSAGFSLFVLTCSCPEP